MRDSFPFNSSPCSSIRYPLTVCSALFFETTAQCRSLTSVKWFMRVECNRPPVVDRKKFVCIALCRVQQKLCGNNNTHSEKYLFPWPAIENSGWLAVTGGYAYEALHGRTTSGKTPFSASSGAYVRGGLYRTTGSNNYLSSDGEL